MQFGFSLVLGIITCLTIMSFSIKYFIRNEFFLSFASFLNNMSLNLNFRQDEIKTIINNTNPQSYQFKFLIKSYKDNLGKENGKFNVDVENASFLSSEEKTNIISFFSKLGKSDSKTQEELINEFKKYAEDKINLCKLDVKNKAILIQKLSIIFGLIVIILLL